MTINQSIIGGFYALTFVPIIELLLSRQNQVYCLRLFLKYLQTLQLFTVYIKRDIIYKND